MAVVQFEVPPEYILVLSTLALTPALLISLFVKVSAARKKYNVPLPTLYVTDAQIEKRPELLAYNCIQRSHQQTLEMMPFWFINMLFLGLYWPKTMSVFGVLFLVGRFIFAYGYGTGVPSRRMPGAMLGLPIMGRCKNCDFRRSLKRHRDAATSRGDGMTAEAVVHRSAAV